MGSRAEPGQNAAKSQNFYAIPCNLYQPDELIERDLYLHYQGEYLLFRPKNLRWNQEDRDRLSEFGVKHLYIHCPKKEEANEFIESNLSRILQESKIDRSAKAQIIFETSSTIIESIFDKPHSPVKIQRSVTFVKNSVEFLKDQDNFIELMRLASQDFNEYTHALQTSAYAIALAQAVGMRSFNELSAIGIGSLLHDIGKVRIDKRILDKGDALNDDERLEVQKHPEYGFEILRRQRSVPQEAETIILQHHERIDGSGYPFGLSDEIAMGIRIVSLVDCFDSLTSNRPYKKKLSAVNALRLIREETQNQYDRDLLVKFIKILGVKP